MPLMALELKTLEDLDDGRPVRAFMAELKRAIADCMDRPGDKNAREVTLQMKLKPTVDEEGNCERVQAEFHTKCKVPIRKTRPYSFECRKAKDGPMLVFSSTSPDVDQTTFDDLDPETGQVRR